MNAIPFARTQNQTIKVTVSLEPVHNVLMTLSLLTSDDSEAEVEPWITETAVCMTPEQKQLNRLVFEGLGSLLLPRTAYKDFQTYLKALAAESPTAIRNRFFEILLPSASMTEMLKEVQGYMAQLRKLYPQLVLDQDIHLEIHRLLNDPAALHYQLTTHLETLWETLLRQDWPKRMAQCQNMVTFLNEHDWTAETASETIRAFIRRDLPDALSIQLAGVKQIIFVPSPYIRLHASRFGSNSTIWVFVLANYWSLPLRAEPIQRSEVLGPLRALADDTRLHLLEALAAHEKLRAQDLINHLDLSQPTVSRHLKQLRSARLIIEERGPEAMKHYRLDLDRFRDVYYRLTQLLSAENARLIISDVRPKLPVALRRFLDRDGRITTWPAKWKSQQVVMDYIIEKFSIDQDYSEAEVNHLLNQWQIDSDAVTLRRALCDAGLLKRTNDGRCYWRAT